MRVAALRGRAVVLTDAGAVDVERASGGRFGAEPQEMYERWEELSAWVAGGGAAHAEGAGSTGTDAAAEPYAAADLTCPVPRPRQVLAIGLNYRDHAAEASLPEPQHPVVFTKFVSSFTGPDCTVVLPSDDVDYETELAVVVGRGGRGIPAEQGWEHVAGVTVAQDLSERTVQRRGPAAQFSLGKSFAGFTPLGPAVVSIDELDDPDDLPIRAELLGEGSSGTVQESTTAQLIFTVPELIARLSRVVELLPGDVILTGTPAGVGLARGRLLRPGDVLVSTVEGIGSITQRFVAA